MAERSFTDSGLRMPSLGVPAPSDALDDESGATQPGQLHPFPSDPTALRIRHADETDGINTIDQASDKFATPFFNLDNKKAYQLLPADPNRKRATIFVAGPNTNIILIGDLATIDAACANAFGGYPLIGGVAGFIYTSKASLYACGALGATIVPTSVFTERFNSGTPVGS